MRGEGEHLAALLPRVARGFGALELAIGDRLALLAPGRQLMRLGYSGLGDYGREVLNLRPRHAYHLAELARALQRTPLLRAQVESGATTLEKAHLVVKEAARGDEVGWTDKAVRYSIKQLRRELGLRAPRPDEWERIALSLTREEAQAFGAAMELAGFMSDRGPAASRAERVEAMAMECLSSACAGTDGSEAPPLGAEDPAPGSASQALQATEDGAIGILVMAGLVPASLEDAPRPASPPPIHVPPHLRARFSAIEAELHRLAELLRPLPEGPPRSPQVLHAELRELAKLRAGWDDLLCRLLRLARDVGAWRTQRSFGAYCQEELGMDERTARSRITLDRRLDQFSPLREALRSGRLGYEKVRRLAFVVEPATVAAWIEKAAPMSVIELERAIDAEQDRKISATGKADVTLPSEVSSLFQEAIMAIREQMGRWLTVGQCIAIMSAHCVAHWMPTVRHRLRQMGRIRRRDGGFCQTPGCSRPGHHAHHIVFLSHGGGDEDENQVSLCEGHHTGGLHRGFIRVAGCAPDRLTWWLGETEVASSRSIS